MYIKLKDFTGKLNKEDVLLMSHDEFVEGGKEIIGIPVTVTSDGKDPVKVEVEDYGI